MNSNLPQELHDRICGFDSDFSFSKELVDDATPVPFFGDYRSANIVTVSINPSSHEFPRTQRRLTHLSDIGYEADFFQKGKRLQDSNAINQIHEGMINYFKTGNWYENWFSKPEKALNIGFSASYFENKEMFPRRAFHTDISPWATLSWGKLTSRTQDALIDENSRFLNWFLAFDQFKEIVILGRDSEGGLSRSSRNARINFPFELIEQDSERVEEFKAGSFSHGVIRLKVNQDMVEKRYFRNSFSPKVRFQSDSDQDKRYELFGAYIKRIVEQR